MSRGNVRTRGAAKILTWEESKKGLVKEIINNIKINKNNNKIQDVRLPDFNFHENTIKIIY